MCGQHVGQIGDQLPILIERGKIYIFISPHTFTPENLISRDRFGQPGHSPHPCRVWRLLTGSSPPLPAFRYGVIVHLALYRQHTSGESRAYWARQSHTDGVHRRGFAGTGPVVVLKQARATGGAAYPDKPVDQ